MKSKNGRLRRRIFGEGWRASHFNVNMDGGREKFDKQGKVFILVEAREYSR